MCTPTGRLGAQVRAGPQHPVNAGVLLCRIRDIEVAPIHAPEKKHFGDAPEMSAYDWHGQKGLRPRCKGPYMLVFCFVGRTRDDGPVPDGQKSPRPRPKSSLWGPQQVPHSHITEKCEVHVIRRYSETFMLCLTG